LCTDLAAVGFQVTGVDSSETGIKAARNLLPHAKFYKMRVYDDPEALPDRDYDAVVSTEVIEQYGFEVISFHGAGRFPLLWKSMILVARKVEAAETVLEKTETLKS